MKMQGIRNQMNELLEKSIQFVYKLEKDLPKNEKSGIIEELSQTKERYDKKEVYALFSGEIKTGKSSLINNILEEDVCTVDSGVCTNTNTVIKWGSKVKITVYFAKKEDEQTEPASQTIKREEIKLFVSEKENKNNKKNVRLIEVEIPNKHLENGLVLIDTPGLGSLNPLHTATTFSMAPMADVIFLVSSADSELTEAEIEYIQRLLDCSKCQSVIHTLTNSDNGDPDTVLKINIEHLAGIKEWKDGELKHCKISNTNYQKYRSGKIDNIKSSGFDVFLNLLEDVENNTETILIKRQLDIIFVILTRLENYLNILLEAIADPKKAQSQQEKIQKAIDRLAQLKNETSIWRIKLYTAIKKLGQESETKVKDEFRDIKSEIKKKLLFDEYIKNPEKLGSIVSSEIISKSSKLQDFLKDKFIEAYQLILDVSELNLIREEIDNLTNPRGSVNLDSASVKIDKVNIYRSAIIGRTFIYGTVGGVVGGVVGSIIGTWLLPGIGTWAGAEIGAVLASGVAGIVGSIVGWIKGEENVKEGKRGKILERITPQIDSAQNNYLSQVRTIIIDGEEKLRIAFEKELKEDIDRCNKLKADIQKVIETNNKRREEIQVLKKELDAILILMNNLYVVINPESKE